MLDKNDKQLALYFPLFMLHSVSISD